MRKIPVFVVVSLVLLVGACAQWSKPGATPDALASDQDACTKAAQASYPPDLGPGATAASSDQHPSMACVPEHGCIVTGTGIEAGGAMEDRNAQARGTAIDQCMIQRGWTK